MHKLNKLEKIMGERISTLQEEIDIATNVKPPPIYIADRRDEIEFLQWTMRIVQWILDRAGDNRHQLQRIGVDKMRLESEDIMKFENILHEKIQELQVELEESYSLRESDILLHEIETFECVLGELSELKSEDRMHNKEFTEGNLNFQYSKRLKV